MQIGSKFGSFELTRIKSLFRIHLDWKYRIDTSSGIENFFRIDLSCREMILGKSLEWCWKSLNSTNFGLNFIPKYSPPIRIGSKKSFQYLSMQIGLKFRSFYWFGLKACFGFIRIESLGCIFNWFAISITAIFFRFFGLFVRPL